MKIQKKLCRKLEIKDIQKGIKFKVTKLEIKVRKVLESQKLRYVKFQKVRSERCSKRYEVTKMQIKIEIKDLHKVTKKHIKKVRS